MKKSLKAFMSGLIDYAGLFPPADLELDPAIRNYAGYRKGSDAWMLSRFILPASMLARLEPYGEEFFKKDAPFDFSVLGKETDTIADFVAELEQVTEVCRQFHKHHKHLVTTDILEVKLPKEAALCGDTDLILAVLDASAEQLAKSDTSPSHVFYEGFFEESWKKDIDVLTQALALHNEEKAGQANYTYAGFKIRCGGIEASMFPGTEQLSYALNCARRQNVALKGTAGLHHPVRHYNDSVQTKMHGFFNVFGGALLAYANDLNDEELAEILCEEDPEQFVFTDGTFTWKEFSITAEEIRELREVALISFGSCSFDEPREDLQKLKLL